jgi:DNA polymerase-3 subunit gamma/tau
VTRRHQALRILVRALVVLGGGFVLLLLGAATAGAASTDQPGPTGQPAAPPAIPSPPPVSLAVPAPAPVQPMVPAPGIATGAAGISVEVAPTGIGLAIDPTTMGTVPAVPDVPTLPPSGPTADDATATTGGEPVRHAVSATSTSRHAAIRDHATTPLDGDWVLAAPPAAPRPRPVTPSDAPLALAVAAPALAAQPTARDGAPGAHVVVGGAVRAVRHRVQLGVVPTARATALADGFHLLLARPG